MELMQYVDLYVNVEKVWTGSGTELDRRLGYTRVRVWVYDSLTLLIQQSTLSWKAERGRGGFGPGFRIVRGISWFKPGSFG